MPAKKPKRGRRARPTRKPAAPPARKTKPTPAPQIPTVTLTPETDAEAFGDDGLTLRQRAFVAAIIGPAGGNATRAAELAGYKSDNYNALRQTASETLNKPNVQRALAAAWAAKLATPEWSECRLKDLAGSSMGNFLSQKGSQLELDLLKAHEAGALGQIREFKQKSFTLPGDDNTLVTEITIKLHDPRAALETLLKLQGKLKDHTEHSGQVLLIDDVTGGGE